MIIIIPFSIFPSQASKSIFFKQLESREKIEIRFVMTRTTKGKKMTSILHTNIYFRLQLPFPLNFYYFTSQQANKGAGTALSESEIKAVNFNSFFLLNSYELISNLFKLTFKASCKSILGLNRYLLLTLLYLKISFVPHLFIEMRKLKTSVELVYGDRTMKKHLFRRRHNSDRMTDRITNGSLTVTWVRVRIGSQNKIKSWLNEHFEIICAI